MMTIQVCSNEGLEPFQVEIIILKKRKLSKIKKIFKRNINLHDENNMILTQTGFHRKNCKNCTFMYKVYDTTGVP